MARLQIAPTKSNLIAVKEQLSIAQDGYELLEQKREILVMELMQMVERVKLLEADVERQVARAYPSLRRMFMAVGRDRAERVAGTVSYDFRFEERRVTVAGMQFPGLSVTLPEPRLAYSYLNSFADCDRVTMDFFDLLKILTEMASIRTVVWRLAREVKKTQRRVNALDKQVIPQTKETRHYIEAVLEERERENVFVLKALKARNGGSQR
jgi:V/A-type H+/Na+-transporting ATPase subunit D